MRRRLTAIVVVGAAATLAPVADAAIPRSLSDAANCTEHTAGPLDYWHCDDGVPSSGGTSANTSGAKAITVPARYRGFAGLPAKAADAAGVPGADGGGEIALDVDVSLPRSAPPPGGYPLLFFMHGCCGGDKTGWQAGDIDASGQRWHYSNAWFASRGYVVVTYTARGFINGEGNGSTGQMQLQSRSYEINDYQHLACQLAGRAGLWSKVSGRRVRIDRKRVVTTGGSYGGGFSWMTVTDPRWRCGAGTGAGPRRMRLAASAPKFGWTDLLYSLVPTGKHNLDPGRLPRFDGCDSGPAMPSGEPCPPGVAAPVGVPKTSIVAGLYATGRVGVGVGVGVSHTTFPPGFDEAIVCLTATYPPTGPQCDRPVGETLPQLLRESSAYYQERFFRKIARKRSWRVPVFSAATFTDPLFTPVEHVRMTNRLKAAAPGYPIQTYNGDYEHFAQNKAKEWGDLCGPDHHVCTREDYRRGGSRPGDFNRAPASRRRTGVTTMLNRFLDHYARPAANRRQRRPRFDSTVSLQVCPQNESGRFPLNEPGPRFRAPSLAAQARRKLRLDLPGTGTTTSLAVPNLHALQADPVVNQQVNGRACAAADGPAGAGVAVFDSEPLAKSRVMIGSTRVGVSVAGAGNAELLGHQLSARMYDVAPDGTTALVDRGLRRLESSSGRVEFGLHGNGWRFAAGHRVRLELAQDDSPFLHPSTPPSALGLSDVSLRIPVR